MIVAAPAEEETEYRIDSSPKSLVQQQLSVLKRFQLGVGTVPRRYRMRISVLVALASLELLVTWAGMLALALYVFYAKVVWPWQDRRNFMAWNDRATVIYHRLLTTAVVSEQEDGLLTSSVSEQDDKEWGLVLDGLRPYSIYKEDMRDQASEIVNIDWKNRQGGKV
jgi:hypothetical protein